VAWASASVERLWKEIEDRLPGALVAMDADTLFGNAEHVSVIKSAIALHFARSKAARIVHARVWAETVEKGRSRWVTEHRQLLAYWFYREKGLYPAGAEALGIFVGEIMGLSLSIADSGALWRERIESLYLQARAMTDAAGLGPRHAAALGRTDRIIHLTSDQTAEVNARQLRGAIEYVYLRPQSPLMDTVRSFAEQRKNAFGTTAA
jgi:hypothetical protein